MTQLINDLKKSIGNLRKQTEALSESITSIRDRIMLLEAEQATILDRPLCKSDFLELCLAQLDRTAETGDERWGRYFTEQAQARYLGRSRRNSIRDIRALHGGKVTTLDDSYLAYGEAPSPGNRPFTAEVVFSLFRDPIKDAVRRQFDQIEWPFPDAPPGQTYFKRLDEIEAELADLRSQESLLVDGTEQLGVPMPKPYDMGGDRYD